MGLVILASGCVRSDRKHYKDEVRLIERTHDRVQSFMEREGRCPEQHEVLGPENGNLYLRCERGFFEVGVNIGFDDAIWLRNENGSRCWSFDPCAKKRRTRSAD